jgi:hypothetical protein
LAPAGKKGFEFCAGGKHDARIQRFDPVIDLAVQGGGLLLHKGGDGSGDLRVALGGRGACRIGDEGMQQEQAQRQEFFHGGYSACRGRFREALEALN